MFSGGNATSQQRPASTVSAATVRSAAPHSPLHDFVEGPGVGLLPLTRRPTRGGFEFEGDQTIAYLGFCRR